MSDATDKCCLCGLGVAAYRLRFCDCGAGPFHKDCLAKHRRKSVIHTGVLELNDSEWARFEQTMVGPKQPAKEEAAVIESNPRVQCSVCGKWLREYCRDENGRYVQIFYACYSTTDGREIPHEGDVCVRCESKLPGWLWFSHPLLGPKQPAKEGR